MKEGYGSQQSLSNNKKQKKLLLLDPFLDLESYRIDAKWTYQL